jgi:hypothetical protein
MRSSRLRKRVDPKLFYELALLCEHLNSIAAPLTNVDKAVARRMHAMHDGRELFLIGRGTGNIVGGVGSLSISLKGVP